MKQFIKLGVVLAVLAWGMATQSTLADNRQNCLEMLPESYWKSNCPNHKPGDPGWQWDACCPSFIPTWGGWVFTGGGTAPHAFDKTVYAAVNTVLPITLDAWDATDIPSQLTYSINSFPSNGSLSGSVAGSIYAPGSVSNLIYTPAIDYIGTDSFTFIANDSDKNSNIATISIVVGPISTPVSMSGLVAYYNLDNDVYDRSGNNNHGDAFGVNQVAGKYGQGYGFNKQQHIRINDATNLDGFSQLTTSLWFNMNGANVDPIGSNQTLMYKHKVNPLDYGNGIGSVYEIKMDGGYLHACKDNVCCATSQAGFMSDNSSDWHHVASVYDGNNYTLYFDGIGIASRNCPGTVYNSSSPLFIGNDGNAAFIRMIRSTTGGADEFVYGNQFVGSIDDVAIFNRALSETEIQNIYNSTTPLGSNKSTDLNGDNKVNIRDIQIAIKVITGAITDQATKTKADLNNDGKVNIRDIQMIVRAIVNK